MSERQRRSTGSADEWRVLDGRGLDAMDRRILEVIATKFDGGPVGLSNLSAAIGEESGSLDHMLNKAAEFYEDEVDEAVKGLSSLMEPIIIVILGGLIGGIVVAMYLPIFKLGQIV